MPDASDPTRPEKTPEPASDAQGETTPRSWRERFAESRYHPSRWTRPTFRKLGKAEKIGAWSVAGVFGLLVAGWVGLNFALADPRFATPVLNWGLHTFANKDAKVTSGKLEHPFASHFTIDKLTWPGRAEAETIAVSFDLFGFLPGRPWTREVIIRNGDYTFAEEPNPATINPQDYVDVIDAKNITLHFTRRGKPREVTITEASGSFSKANVKAEAVAGRNHLSFDGLARRGGGFGGHVTAKGENLKDLADVVGASAPDTPPFNVKGELATHGRTWDVTGLTGRMGDSDIGGQVKVDLAKKKPFLTVDLTSRELDFDDLGVVFGIPIGIGKGEATNDEQRKAKAAYDRSARLIPDARIDFNRLKAVDADITFNALAVRDAPSGINRMNFNGKLRDSVLDFDKFFVGTPTGNLDAKVKLNAQKDPAVTDANGSLQKVAITRLINSPFIRGTINGKFALKLTGSGFREAAGTATGEVGLWSNDSELAHIADEAAGLDLGEILLLLTKENTKTDYLKSRCLAANIAFADGRASLVPAVLDNKDSLITVTGGADLKTEALDLKVESHPHDVSFGKLFGDIKITGTLRHPSVSAINSKTILQAGLSALLSSLSGPLGALPFLETGGGPDAPCAELLADAKDAGKSQDPRASKKTVQKS